MTGVIVPNNLSKTLPMALVFPGCVDGFGGAESQALEFLKAYDSTVLDIDLVILGDNPSLAQRAREIDGLLVHELCPSSRHVWSPRIMTAYYSLLRKRGYRLVHLYGLRQEIMTRPLSKVCCKVQVVSAIRGTEDHRGIFHQILNRATSGFVDLWIANSFFARKVFLDRISVPDEKVHVVHNGVLIGNRFSEKDISRSPFAIGCVANHFPEKRISDLILAVAGLVTMGNAVKLFLVGRETSHTPVLLALVEKLGLNEHVHFLGYRSDVADLLSSFHVLVLPSEKESFPSSLLEGMSKGLPVVASTTAGIPEMIIDGITGFLHEPGDVIHLQKHLSVLIGNPDLCEKMGSAGAARVRDQFSVDKLVQNLTERYRHLMIT